jgi:hypothetical protein
MSSSLIKHFLRLWLLLICSFSCVGSFAATYQFIGPTTPNTWIDISTSGTLLAPTLGDDATSAAVNIGFTFNFGNTAFTQVQIGSNGWLFLGTGAGTTTNTAFNNSAVATAVAAPAAGLGVTNVMMPFWDDLYFPGGGSIRTQTLGAAPNRSFVISYLGVPHYQNTANATNTYTFQVVLYENGQFQYNYQTTPDQGASATIGYAISTTDLVQFSFNTANAIPNSRTLTWYISPSLVNLKTVTAFSDPFNNITNPKYIPGAVAQYTINISNTSAGVVDSGSTVITDPIPANTEMFTGGLSATVPFTFADGAPVSGLACTFVSLASATDCIDFSNNGGTTWTYTPIATSDYDPAVTNIRFRPTGALNGDTPPAAAPYPNFSLNFKVRIK